MSQTHPEPLLEATGERLIPGHTDILTYWDHLYRYKFALQFVGGKRVLDVACGEGYGTCALRDVAGASSVLGVDCSPDACRHATEKYQIPTVCSDAASIPVEAASFDVVVSFETVEHLASPARFVEECSRLLTSTGTLIISTPNPVIYHQHLSSPNPFHCSELTESEFAELLTPSFRQITWYGQRPKHARWWQRHAVKTKGSIWLRNPATGGLIRWLTPLQIRRDFQLLPGEIVSRDAVGDIARPESRASTWVNPFTVYRRSLYQDDQPYYFLAVCRK